MSRILVVDDEAQLRKSLRINLAARDYEVIEADDGRGARVSVQTAFELVLNRIYAAVERHSPKT